MKLLYPDLYLDTIYDIDLELLKQKGINGIITDLDNTLVGWDVKEYDDRLRAWVEEVKSLGLKICIVSNNSAARVNDFANKTGLYAISSAKKPRKKAFKQALQSLELNSKEAAVIGDQIFTDILGGNRMGLYTILIIPISQKEFIGTKVVRRLEKIFLKRLNKK